MRRLGMLDDEQRARHLSVYLSRLGIENTVRRYHDDFEIWVQDDRLDEAVGYLEQYRRRPPRASPQTISQVGPQPLTLGLMMVCVAVYLLSLTPFRNHILLAFFLYPEAVVEGQWWRLITPVLLHFNVLHIVFNMLWLYLLGKVIEYRESAWLLAVLVLSIGIGSNYAQWYMAGPNFGGMSGVIYGLLGYIWMCSWRDPGSGYYVENGVVTMMLAWLVICFTGLVGPVANTAHVSGLLLGVIWGLLPRRI